MLELIAFAINAFRLYVRIHTLIRESKETNKPIKMKNTKTKCFLFGKSRPENKSIGKRKEIQSKYLPFTMMIKMCDTFITHATVFGS